MERRIDLIFVGRGKHEQKKKKEQTDSLTTGGGVYAVRPCSRCRYGLVHRLYRSCLYLTPQFSSTSTTPPASSASSLDNLKSSEEVLTDRHQTVLTASPHVSSTLCSKRNNDGSSTQHSIAVQAQEATSMACSVLAGSPRPPILLLN